MQSWIDEQIAQQRYGDMLRTEQLRQLVSVAVGARPQPPRFYGPWLAGFGRRLAIWGCWLELRYTTITVSGGRVRGC